MRWSHPSQNHLDVVSVFWSQFETVLKWERFLNQQMSSYSISVSVWDHYHGYWDWDGFLNPGPDGWPCQVLRWGTLAIFKVTQIWIFSVGILFCTDPLWMSECLHCLHWKGQPLEHWAKKFQFSATRSCVSLPRVTENWWYMGNLSPNIYQCFKIEHMLLLTTGYAEANKTQNDYCSRRQCAKG